jgi:MscS family membrane protein
MVLWYNMMPGMPVKTSKKPGRSMKVYSYLFQKFKIQLPGKHIIIGYFLCLLFTMEVSAEKKLPLAPAVTSSPRDTLNSFMTACSSAYQMVKYREEHVKRHGMESKIAEERIMECLDLSYLPEFLRAYASRKAALCLKETLDRIPLPPLGEIPGKKEIRDPDAKKLLSYTIPDTEIRIVRMEEGPQKGEYLFSADTVANAERYYNLVKKMPYKPGSTKWERYGCRTLFTFFPGG